MAEEDKIRQNPFRVPENYFDEVNMKILASAAANQKSRKLPLIPNYRHLLAVAASVAVLITATFLSVRLLEKKTLSPGISQLINISPEVLLNEIDLLTLENNAEGSDFEQEPDLTSNEIMDYLVDEDIDISMIYEKL